MPPLPLTGPRTWLTRTPNNSLNRTLTHSLTSRSMVVTRTLPGASAAPTFTAASAMVRAKFSAVPVWEPKYIGTSTVAAGVSLVPSPSPPLRSDALSADDDMESNAHRGRGSGFVDVRDARRLRTRDRTNITPTAAASPAITNDIAVVALRANDVIVSVLHTPLERDTKLDMYRYFFVLAEISSQV
eukprot:GHVU01071170.1.p1 GENE.GHVU01071170.1~~GHVU01071170.1.p1  ORF type:complete len:186 (+),score=10.29 GHVU01071170.1:566-1123(+)